MSLTTFAATGVPVNTATKLTSGEIPQVRELGTRPDQPLTARHNLASSDRDGDRRRRVRTEDPRFAQSLTSVGCTFRKRTRSRQEGW